MKSPENTSYLKLPFHFSKEKLLRDLALVLDQNWMPHFNTRGYVGDWSVISLFAKNGDASDIFAVSSTAESRSETPMLKNCGYFKHVIETFQCPILTARILRLGAGAEIKPHRDYKLGYEDGQFRIHVPIVTNSSVQFMLDNKVLNMLPGECWYTNVNFVHSVKNAGKTDRVHLVIDGERNKWSDDLFFSLAPKESFNPPTKKLESRETILRMLEELENRKEPAAQQLIHELSMKLKVFKSS